MNKLKGTALGVAVSMLAGWTIWPSSVERPPPTPASARPLRVVTYNVQFLPLPILNKRPDGPYRAAEVTRRLTACDIVGLNEVFEAARREQILAEFQKAWGADFHCVLPSDRDRTLFGLDSGLVLLTRLPLVETHSLVFGNDSTIREKGVFADGFAAKGVLHARLRRAQTARQEQLIDCFLTHLESSSPQRREEQYPLLADFIREHSAADVPVILMGDLNTVGDQAQMHDPDSQYNRLQQTLAAARPSWIDLGQWLDPATWGTSRPEANNGGERIDYILFSNGPTGHSLRPLAARTRSFPDPRVQYLSDHCAVEAEFDF